MTDAPDNSQFGWAKPARIEEFEKLKGDAKAHQQILFKGEKCTLPIIRVDIDLPKYRLENGRTASAQEEYLAKNPAVAKDIFTADPELWTAQAAQHKLLIEMGKQSELQQFFEDEKNIQTEVIMLDEHGFVVNGNRRLAAWRDLAQKDKTKYGHFENIDVIVLPHCDQKEIDRIEARLQIARDIRADYSWDARAKMLKAKQKRDSYSDKEVGELYEMSKSEVIALFDMLSYAEEFLKSRGKEGHWSLVSKQELAFQKIAQTRSKITSIGKQELFKELSFALMDNPDDAGGRLYEQIPAIYTHLEAVSSKLLEKFPVAESDSGDDGLEDVFGVSPVPSSESSADIPLINIISKPENIGDTREIVVDVLEVQKQLKRDSKDANFLIACCAKAQSNLTAAVAELKAETKTAGVDIQLKAIEELLATIRAFIAKDA